MATLSCPRLEGGRPELTIGNLFIAIQEVRVSDTNGHLLPPTDAVSQGAQPRLRPEAVPHRDHVDYLAGHLHHPKASIATSTACCLPRRSHGRSRRSDSG